MTKETKSRKKAKNNNKKSWAINQIIFIRIVNLSERRFFGSRVIICVRHRTIPTHTHNLRILDFPLYFFHLMLDKSLLSFDRFHYSSQTKQKVGEK